MARKKRLIVRVFYAQNGLCGICGHEMPQIGQRPIGSPSDMMPTADHVYPRRPPPRQVRARNPKYIRPAWDKIGIVAAHGRCNTLKGNRPPTGCEVIVLMLVNAITDRPTIESQRRSYDRWVADNTAKAREGYK